MPVRRDLARARGRQPRRRADRRPHARAGHDLARLRAGFAACLETNVALVTGIATDDRVALEQLLVKLIG